MLRKTLAVLFLLVFGSTLTSADSLTKAERKRAVKHLETTRKAFLKSINGLSEEQWKWKAAPDRWSVAECAEHITLSENLILQLVNDRVLKTPATPEKKAEVAGKDDAVLRMIPDRSQKFQAPEMIQPKGTYPSRQALAVAFKDSRAKTITFVRTTPDDLRVHFFPHPVMKDLDGYQWILLLSAHTERHTRQINEVLADPNFPKKR